MKERAIEGFMRQGGGASSPSSVASLNTKKQSNLLSFFGATAASSPKRKIEINEDKTMNSPSKKSKEEFYAMISEGEEAELMTMLDDAKLNTPVSNKVRDKFAPELKEDLSQFAAGDVAQTRHEFFGVEETRKGEEEDQQMQRYGWLVDVKDAAGKRPGEEGYDKRTLFIPREQWDRFTPFEKQFWEIKSGGLWDTVVFFKKGKFYELYEGDADIGARDFGLKMTERVNMRMVGVPEVTFELWSGRFVSRGYRVARVDQTETALGKELRERDERQTEGSLKGKKDKIVRRELSCILTVGTLQDPSGTMAGDAAAHLVALKQSRGELRWGMAVLDAAGGTIRMGELLGPSALQTMLMQLQPRELLVERGGLCRETERILKAMVPGALCTKITSGSEFLDGHRSSLQFDELFKREWPSCLKEEGGLSLCAVGAIIWYLKELKLEEAVLGHCSFSAYNDENKGSTMILDGNSLLSLDILPAPLADLSQQKSCSNSSLLGLMNRCKTGMGKRQMQRWICQPLAIKGHIDRRLDTVSFLLEEQELLSELHSLLGTMPDLERLLGRIEAGTIKLADFLSVITAFCRINLFHSALQNRSLPDLLNALQSRFAHSDCTIDFDVELAKKEGLIVPQRGLDPSFDRARDVLAERVAELHALLEKERQKFGIAVCFRDVGKEPFQLEFPIEANLSPEYSLMSRTSKVKRYWTPRLRELVRLWQEANERLSTAQRTVYGAVLARFAQSSTSLWRPLIEALSNLDCLCSLAIVSAEMSQPKCRPLIIDAEEGQLTFEDLRHPLAESSNFIPNSLALGHSKGDTHERAQMLLLTGPNMGGKSTLLRQVCLATVMAQMGCYVPASSFALSPIDRIFTRLGAHDNIVRGASTFMVELQDAALVLNHATCRSLVILDELGRGTSTHDGRAIAHALLLHLLNNQRRPLTLFATHYRPLALHFSSDPRVSLQHMGCLLQEASRRVTFLYKLVPGVAPRSYGINVALMAGIPPAIVQEAETMAAQFEAEHTEQKHREEEQQVLSLVNYYITKAY